MIDKTDQIAGKFLGKDGDNNKVAAYKNPENVDNSLLVAIPRSLNRDAHNIDSSLFEGFDCWNCYEVSTLNAKGKPFVGIAKLFFPADSTNIVESKSLKLYLNSFNLAKMQSIDSFGISKELEAIISNDLQEKIGDKKIQVKVLSLRDSGLVRNLDFLEFENIDELDVSIDLDVQESLESEQFQDIRTLKVHSALLRSNCRVTNQPDWGDVYIYLKGKDLPTKESLLKYIISMRKEQHFHEEICENIFNDIYQQCALDELLVKCFYTRRGGVDINPIRYTEGFDTSQVITYYENETVFKTLRQ